MDDGSSDVTNQRRMQRSGNANSNPFANLTEEQRNKLSKMSQEERRAFFQKMTAEERRTYFQQSNNASSDDSTDNASNR
jgi:Spy/CpxP family protein refolding chaperone